MEPLRRTSEVVFESLVATPWLLKIVRLHQHSNRNAVFPLPFFAAPCLQVIKKKIAVVLYETIG